MNVKNAFEGAHATKLRLHNIDIVVIIFPEMLPRGHGIQPSGNYFVHGIHPNQGSFNMIVEQSTVGHWSCKFRPPFINSEFIRTIGKYLERTSMQN